MNENPTKTLKFYRGPSTTLAIADECDRLAATVRYGDEKGIEEGDTLRCLCARTGEEIGTATVENTETVRVRKALDVVTGWWAEYGIETADRLADRLNGYYDERITRETDVKVMILNPDMDGEWRTKR